MWAESCQGWGSHRGLVVTENHTASTAAPKEPFPCSYWAEISQIKHMVLILQGMERHHPRGHRLPASQT